MLGPAGRGHLWRGRLGPGGRRRRDRTAQWLPYEQEWNNTNSWLAGERQIACLNFAPRYQICTLFLDIAVSLRKTVRKISREYTVE